MTLYERRLFLGIDITSDELIHTLKFFYRLNKSNTSVADTIIKIGAALLDTNEVNTRKLLI